MPLPNNAHPMEQSSISKRTIIEFLGGPLDGAASHFLEPVDRLVAVRIATNQSGVQQYDARDSWWMRLLVRLRIVAIDRGGIPYRFAIYSAKQQPSRTVYQYIATSVTTELDLITRQLHVVVCNSLPARGNRCRLTGQNLPCSSKNM